MANNNPAHIVLRNVRLSYAHIMEPHASNNNPELKYSTTLLIPKSNTNNKMLIDNAIAVAAENGRTRFGSGFPATPKHTLHDGDGVNGSGTPYGPECKGCWVLNTSSKQKPEVVDLSGQPILAASEIYSGIYANVSVTFYPYMAQGNKGVAAGLGNVQKISDGEPLGGRTTAEDDFGPAADAVQPAGAPGYAVPQPTYMQQTVPTQALPNTYGAQADAPFILYSAGQ